MRVGSGSAGADGSRGKRGWPKARCKDCFSDFQVYESFKMKGCIIESLDAAPSLNDKHPVSRDLL
jgi:hypothetical protein